MSAKNKTQATPQVLETKEEEVYPLVYDFENHGGIHIHAASGSNVTVIFQTGKANNPPPPPFP